MRRSALQSSVRLSREALGELPLARTGGKWTAKKLDRFLKNPKGLIKGTKMQFSGIADSEDRKSLIAYLTSLSPD